MAAETTRAVGYIRTATTTATEREHCTATQARQIRHYCNERGIALVGSFEDHGAFEIVVGPLPASMIRTLSP
jgi:hypothetical protein